jgi:hypothetical protein
MGSGEGRDDLRQGAQVEVEQAADGMMVIEPIALGRERAEASRTLEPLDARDQTPSAGLVAAHDGSPWAQPAVVE